VRGLGTVDGKLIRFFSVQGGIVARVQRSAARSVGSHGSILPII
jgi:hypothetical protein